MADLAVLVVTSIDDVTADLVIIALNERGVPVVRADPAEIGNDLRFSARIGSGAEGWGGSLWTGTREADLSRMRSVYWRRPSPWRFDHLPPQARAFSALEAKYGMVGLLSSMSVLYVNHPSAEAAADYKPVQLRVAADLGFTVPDTLITNDLSAARRFADEYAPVIYKPFKGVPATDGRTGVIWAQRITAADLDTSISVTAHMLQAEVEPKVADARVTVVGRQVFASLITTPGRLLDWRAGDWTQLSYEPAKVPAPVIERMHAYLDRFGLVFGCFDFAVTADERWHWIECNPNGQWGFLPDSGGIAAAFADLLQAG